MANGVEQEGLNIEQAMASGINPELAIVGTEEYNTSTRQATGVPAAGSPIMSPQFGAQAPSYGWGVGAQDLGQGAVQQIRTDQFVTPVAMQQYPAGAIAARNQSLAQQRMAVEKAKQDALKAFDWTKGLESPAAQHEYAWWQYLTNTWWPQTVSKFAEAYGVTPEEAISMMATTPEGQRYLQLETMKANSAARFSRGMTDRYMDILGKIQEGKMEVDEDERKAILEYVNAVDPTTGVPYEFNDMEDLVKRAVNFEATMSMAAFKDKFLRDFDMFAQEVSTVHPPAYGKGGNVVLTKEVEQRFGEFKSGMLQAAKELGMNEDKVRDFMDEIIKDRIKKEATLHPNRYATSRGSGSSKGPMPVKAQMRAI